MQSKLVESRLPIPSLLLIAPFFFWGTAMVAMKGAIDHTTPLFLAGVRLVPAGLLVLLAAFLMGRRQPQTWQAWLWISLFALVDGTLFQGFLAEGLVRTGAGLGSVMIDSQPLAVALLALWFFGERIGLWGWLGLGMGIIGISLLGLPDAWILGGLGHGLADAGQSLTLVSLVSLIQSLFQNGQWLMLLAALSMALGTVISRFVSRHVDPIVATGWHMILGGIPLFAGSTFWEVNQWSGLSLPDWAALGYSTVFGSAIAYALFFYFASSGSLTSLSSLTFLTPIFALAFGNLLLGEELTPVKWIGVSLSLLSIYLINQRDKLTKDLPPLEVRSEASIELVSLEEEVLKSRSENY
ncbi:MAG: EamA family transporter [Leptolyngbyaceae cyanobacterium bins.59]|nr:EamA family transporter [Leptolyngbyaceae cyanobacterium bins.59]